MLLSGRLFWTVQSEDDLHLALLLLFGTSVVESVSRIWDFLCLTRDSFQRRETHMKELAHNEDALIARLGPVAHPLIWPLYISSFHADWYKFRRDWTCLTVLSVVVSPSHTVLRLFS